MHVLRIGVCADVHLSILAVSGVLTSGDACRVNDVFGTFQQACITRGASSKRKLTITGFYL